MSLRPAWSTKQVLGQPGLLQGETLSQKTKPKEEENTDRRQTSRKNEGGREAGREERRENNVYKNEEEE